MLNLFKALNKTSLLSIIVILMLSKESRALECPTNAVGYVEVNKIIKQKQPFERMVITKEEGLELFADNPFKVSILTTKVPDGGRTTVYRCGDLIDLCRGPHVAHTGNHAGLGCDTACRRVVL